jgi:membrane-associated phospholipid phosphatase
VGTPALAGDSPRDFREAFGPRFERSHDHQKHASTPARHDAVRRWNKIAIDASGLDHTPVAPGEDRVFGEQYGPGRAARAMAIVHIAVFDAVNAIAAGYASYSGLPRARYETSLDAAVAQAAHDTLAALFPSQAGSFAAALAGDLARIRPGSSKARGIELGARAAAAILALRAADGSQHPEPVMGSDYIPGDAPGVWRQDPISLIPLALGAHWGEVEPFVLEAGDQFRLPPPPSMESAEYAAAFDEVKALGGDGIVTPTIRTADQTHVAIFWAYDGTPSLCAPPRLYNQIAVQIADQRGTGTVALARLLALVNVSLADAAIAAWDSKYHYAFWRPVTGIREADEGSGPSGLGDGNPATIGDPDFWPLGAPASNLAGPNFTPPFPAYPSGHATIGGALFETLRRFYGTDRIAFSFVSDEFNGETLDNEGNVRPLLPRSFRKLSEAEEENGQSRIYLGIHWSFDKTEGIAQGRRVGSYVFRNAFQPKRR